MDFNVYKNSFYCSRYTHLGKKKYFKDNISYGNGGQDAYGIFSYPEDNIIVVIVADGHGRHGHIFSKNVIEKMLSSLKETSPDKVITKEYQINLFNQIDRQQQRQFLDKTGGTTASFVVIKKDIDKTNVYVTYVGDSPVYAKVSDTVHCLGGDDGWDCKDSVKRYLSYCKRNSYEPKKVIYNRINVFTDQHPTDYRPYGISDVIPVYDYDMENCIPVLNRENYLKLAKLGHPYGIQTLETFPTHEEVIDDVKVLVADKGFEDCNWGNTLEGNLQTRTSIGDFIYGIHAPCDPVYKEYTFDKSVQIGVMSDGWDDFGSKEEVMDLLIGLKSSEKTAMKYISHYLKSKFPDRHDEFIYWNKFYHDDVTFILVN